MKVKAPRNTNRLKFKSIDEALAIPMGKLFWISVDSGKAESGDGESLFGQVVPDEHLTFDIGNNKVLVNSSLGGAIKAFTTYRGTYASDSGMAGVWWHKDSTSTGPYSFRIRLGKRIINLAEVLWPMKMGLLDNIFPLTTLTGDGLEIKLIVFAPISADGKERPSAAFYGTWIKNISSRTIEGAVLPPPGMANSMVEIADGVGIVEQVPMKLKPGQTMWVPAVLAAVPAQDTMKQVSRRSSLEWLAETHAHYRRMFGRLSMPGDPFMAEFFERTVCQCFHSITMNAVGEVVGANWSGYPATQQIWMKDMFYGCLPLAIHEPELLTRTILWFLDRSVRYPSDKSYGGIKFRGDITHSLSNALTPVALAGMYYVATGDKKFFRKHPEVVAKIKELLAKVLATRRNGPFLFKSDWLSDGPTRCDYHTGSNVIAWYCFKTAADIADGVLGEPLLARKYRDTAARIKRALDAATIAPGPFGLQYTEGAFADGSVFACHDGEETDVALMPFYGYTQYDDPAYQNDMRVAMTPHNPYYSDNTKGIIDSTWIGDNTPKIEATFPGYMTGLAGVQNADEMSGPDGRMTIIRRLTDVDGSVWWWPYRDGKIQRGYVLPGGITGKSGWASSVYAVHFVSQVLGLSYDGRARVLMFRPFSPTSDFTWEDFRLGGARFSVALKRTARRVECQLTNHNEASIVAELELPLTPGVNPENITVNGKKHAGAVEVGRFFDSVTAKLSVKLRPGTRANVAVSY